MHHGNCGDAVERCSKSEAHIINGRMNHGFIFLPKQDDTGYGAYRL